MPGGVASRQLTTAANASHNVLSYADISRAAINIRGGVLRTQLYRSYFLSELLGCNLYL